MVKKKRKMYLELVKDREEELGEHGKRRRAVALKGVVSERERGEKREEAGSSRTSNSLFNSNTAISASLFYFSDLELKR